MRFDHDTHDEMVSKTRSSKVRCGFSTTPKSLANDAGTSSFPSDDILKSGRSPFLVARLCSVSQSTLRTKHKRATRNGDLNNNIAEHHLQTNHRIDWDSAECVIYNTDYYQRLTLESWFINLEQTPLNRCQQLPAPYKRLINDTKTDKQ